jgi:Flp pilus assembly protein TadG
VTAEFAIALPGVVMVLACCLSALQVSTQQLRLHDAAASAARSIARGEDAGAAAARASRMVSGARLASRSDDDLLCVTLSAPSAALAASILGLTLHASSCSLAGGR